MTELTDTWRLEDRQIETSQGFKRSEIMRLLLIALLCWMPIIVPYLLTQSLLMSLLGFLGEAMIAASIGLYFRFAQHARPSNARQTRAIDSWSAVRVPRVD